MSNSLLRIAHRVTGLPAMARQVLVVLADEARDTRGGRSSLTTAQIADRTALSRRTIHRAYVVLATAGHITREETQPGAPVETLVHPMIGVAVSGADLAEGYATVSDPLCQPVRGSIEYKDITIDHSPQAGAREISISGFQGPAPTPVPAQPIEPSAPMPAPAERELEPAAQVIAAWNAMAARCGLPGPVTLDLPREAAIDTLLRREKLWRVLAAVDAVGRSAWLTGKGANRQGDWMATFDWVFEVRRFAGAGNFNRILEGEFNRGQAVPEAAAAPVDHFSDVGKMVVDPDEPAPTRALRTALAGMLGPGDVRAWIEPLAFEWRGDEMLAVAGSAFAADHVRSQFAGQLGRAAAKAAGGPMLVRVMVRAKARETVHG
jgi:hypothetical protein